MRRHVIILPQTWLLAALACLVATAGCSRSHYRRQADKQANCLIDQKAALVGSDAEGLRINVDPRSRMYSAESPDCPAMPPDDPIAHSFIEQVDCKRGSRANRFARRTPFVENPDWLAHMPRDEQGNLVLDLTAAVDVSLLHSTDYQENLEELYLSSLDVAFERFRFDAQFFGGSSVQFTADGRDRSGSGDSESELAVSPSRSANPFTINKLTATGGELVAGFANSLVWQFAGPDDYSSTTLLDFTLVQPLLRAGGRTVVLERLTIAERALLANVRIMERYRRGFYLSVATGADPGSGPSRRGGFFGGAGLEGFTGVGGGGFGRIGGATGFGNAGGAGAASAGGYIGLLQQSQELRNQRANIVALRASVDQLQASFDAGRLDRFQVDLARQALFNGQSQLLAAEADLQTEIDDFLVELGLPPNIAIKLSDDMLDPFQLRSDDLTTLQAQASQLVGDLRAAATIEGAAANENDQLNEVIPLGPIVNELPPPELIDNAEELAQTRLEELTAQARSQLAIVEQDFAILQAASPARREHLAMLAKRKDLAAAQIDAGLLAPDRFDRRVEAIRNDLDQLTDRLLAVIGEPSDSMSKEPQSLELPLAQRAERLSALLLELSLIQARARLDTIDIEPTQLSDENALAIAMLYRRDLKNARSALVDSWRLINFNANTLLSDLDLTFSGDLGNVGDNPFRLRDTNGRLRVGIEFDGPLTRLSERNTYRQSLIEFQQARRTYYQFVDRVSQGLRATLRQVRLNEINLELRREAVLIAISQVDLTQLRLSEPPKPGVETQLSSTTARDLVDALSDLLNVQNDFLSVWVNNEVLMLSLEFNLGLMELDASGQRLPLAMPVEDFLYAYPCTAPGGQERLPGDVEPQRLPTVGEECLPLQLQFTPDLTQSAQPVPANRSSQVKQVSFSSGLLGHSEIRRLPSVENN